MGKIAGKGENVGKGTFSPYPTVSSIHSKTNFIFFSHIFFCRLQMLLIWSKNLLFDKGNGKITGIFTSVDTNIDVHVYTWLEYKSIKCWNLIKSDAARKIDRIDKKLDQWIRQTLFMSGTIVKSVMCLSGK